MAHYDISCVVGFMPNAQTRAFLEKLGLEDKFAHALAPAARSTPTRGDNVGTVSRDLGEFGFEACYTIKRVRGGWSSHYMKIILFSQNCEKLVSYLIFPPKIFAI